MPLNGEDDEVRWKVDVFVDVEFVTIALYHWLNEIKHDIFNPDHRFPPRLISVLSMIMPSTQGCILLTGGGKNSRIASPYDGRLSFSSELAGDCITRFRRARVQQELTKPKVLERFLPREHVAAVRDTFADMQNLDDSAEGRRTTQLACSQTSAENYFLKPNLERSAMNVVRRLIARFMCRVTQRDRPKYTLMEFLNSPLTDNILLREHMVFEGKVTSELGIVGGCIWKRKVPKSGEYGVEMLSDRWIGGTFRTKPLTCGKVAR